FEFSVGAERLIVNCGSSEQMAVDGWQKVSRTTAAHSTLVIDNRNSSSILDNQRIGRWPKKVSVIRDEMDDTVAIDVTHSGYVPAYGYEHERILRIKRSGKELSGTDALKPAGRTKRGPIPFDVRFHLHPSIETRPSVDGAAVELVLPSGGVWRFETMLGVAVEESVYLGERGRVQPSQQLLVSGAISGQTTQVNWRLLKLSS
ncbi:MAG: heparinase II/III-family protein, partial [Proteobacteria bacterium]|nr:heparinase II/III-family protein [Pseudomonadota bacterium]